MSPFRSKAQERAAFGGYLGPEMKSRAKEFADETPSIKSLPNRVKPAKPQPKAVKKSNIRKPRKPK